MFRLRNVFCFLLMQIMVFCPLMAFSATSSDVTTETIRGKQTKTHYKVKEFTITKKGKPGVILKYHIRHISLSSCT